MAARLEIKATVRPRVGKGAARAVRREGKIPAVIYGDNKPAESITLEFRELQRHHLAGRFTSQVVELDVDGKKHRVIPREVQTDPVRDFPIHVDFQRISAKSRLRLVIPVEFVNEEISPGLKRGGVLNIVRHEVEVTCPPDQIPTVFEVDLAEADIGDSIHWSALSIPEGVAATILDRDFTVATIAGASAKGVDDEDEDEAETEGEGEGAEEGAEATGEDAKDEDGDKDKDKDKKK